MQANIKEDFKMKEQLEARMKELKSEFETGQKALEEMDMQRTNLVYTLLRINGAIQVLEELVQKEASSDS
jgi:predicted nuclease with TOPRIM domain